MAYSLLLIGVGQLGIRYLQGLMHSKLTLHITIVDPSVNALVLAESIWAEVGGGKSSHTVRFATIVPLDLCYVDLVMVVTNSKDRADLIAKVASQIKVSYWVIEKVLAQSGIQIDLINTHVAKSKGAWVNTPRRTMTWHKLLKNEFSKSRLLTASYFGGMWGLACNSIHFIDLVSWWTGEQLISINAEGLDKSWFDSKRAGYMEVCGKLVANFSGASSLVLESRNDVMDNLLRVEMDSGDVWDVNENNGVAISSNGNHILGRIEFQSQLSGRLVDEILIRGQCDLPTLKESVDMHAVFLEAMLKHWNLSQKRNDVCVPIT